MKTCELIGTKRFMDNWGNYCGFVGISIFFLGFITLAAYFITQRNLYGNILESQGVDLELIERFEEDTQNLGYKVYVDHPELLKAVQKVYGGKE